MRDLEEDHPAIDEILQFGARGPTGQGLGRFGGHAVSD